MTAIQPSPAFTTLAFRERVVRELADIQDQQGVIPHDLVEEYATLMAVHPDSLRRMVRKFKTTLVMARPQRKSFKALPDENAAQVTFFKHSGDATATFKELETKGLAGGMGLKTFQRRVKAWGRALIACAKGGHRAMVKYQFFNREHQPYRTYVFATDHTKLKIRVLPMRGTTPVFPWLSILMDLKTRVILCFILTTADATTDDTLSLLAEGIRGRQVEGRGFVGGMPEFLRTDRGGDYISNALALGLIRLDITHQFTGPYSSYQNGRVERAHGRIDTQFAPTQVGYQAGGEDTYTKRIRQTVLPDQMLDTIDTLRASLDEWVEEYNNTPHRALKGATPYEAWFSDPHPIKTADRDLVATGLKRCKALKLQNYGLDFRGGVYTAPEFAEMFNHNQTSVEARYWELDDTEIEVFYAGNYVGTATRTDKARDTVKVGHVSHRRAQVRQTDRLAALANYEKALDREEDLRRRGVPKSEWPTRPPKPDEKPNSATASEPGAEEQRPESTSEGGLFRPPTAEELTRRMNDAS